MSSKNKVILIVDDDVDVLNYLKTLLENVGHEVHVARDLSSARATLTTVYPHLVFLDINIEDENGFSFISDIKKIDPYKRIKIIMISSLTSKKALAVSQQYGTDGYLVKPINNDILLTTMKKIGPSCKFPDAKNLEPKFSGIMCKLLGTITSISEVNVTLRSKVKFQEKQKINLECEFIDKLELNHAQFIINPPSTDISPGVYDTEIQMVGLNDNDLKEIRKIKAIKG